jgi:DNA polymerase-3 subunit delta'
LVAENRDQILNTILSRTQLIKINRFSDSEIKSYLIEDKGLDDAKAEQIAYLSEGNLNTAISLIKGEADFNFRLFADWLRMCFSNKVPAIIDFVETAAKSGRENQKNFLKFGMKMIREVLICLSGVQDLIHLPAFEKEFIINVSKTINPAKAEAMFTELEKAHYHIERNANPKILFLDVSLQFVKILKFNTLPLAGGTQHIYN